MPAVAEIGVREDAAYVTHLLVGGWRVAEFDLYMATEPGLLDPGRVVPSPALA